MSELILGLGANLEFTQNISHLNRQARTQISTPHKGQLLSDIHHAYIGKRMCPILTFPRENYSDLDDRGISEYTFRQEALSRLQFSIYIWLLAVGGGGVYTPNFCSWHFSWDLFEGRRRVRAGSTGEVWRHGVPLLLRVLHFRPPSSPQKSGAPPQPPPTAGRKPLWPSPWQSSKHD